MLTGKDYCDYETCVALKEMGYKGMSRYYYTQRDHKLHYDTYNKFYTVRTADAMGYVLAIHLYEAQKWLREERGIIVYPMSIGDLQHQKWYAKIEYMDFYCYPVHDTYEEALSEGLREAIKILKEE